MGKGVTEASRVKLGVFVQKHLQERAEWRDHLMPCPPSFPLKLLGSKLLMTHFTMCKRGLISQGILAAAVTTSLWYRCILSPWKHLYALHSKSKWKIPCLGLKRTITPNKNMCLPCCLKSMVCWAMSYVVVEIIRIKLMIPDSMINGRTFPTCMIIWRKRRNQVNRMRVQSLQRGYLWVICT